ncbi:MAG: AAA family ATPase [Actinomycetota bacterium]|nr:AAA family ATPase [Actinomycetota bacterium]
MTVRDGKAGLPYSKGLMATSIMAAGLPPSRAYSVAEVIEQRLHRADRDSVTSRELREMAAAVLADQVGERYADNYRRWQRAKDRTVPLVVLIGGTTGVGKSTVATTLAAQLGIVRIVSTDAVREVMRGIFTKEMMPSIHASSYDVAPYLREPPEETNSVITGFRRQVQAVSVGVTQVIRRAVVEGTDLIVEGVHVVPGFLELPGRAEAIVASMVITVDDEQLHRSHFAARAADTRSRRDRHYLEHFDDIRRIQSFVRDLAVQHSVAVIPSYSLDTTISRVMELVVTDTTDSPPTCFPRSGPADPDLLDRVVPASRPAPE